MLAHMIISSECNQCICLCMLAGTRAVQMVALLFKIAWK